MERCAGAQRPGAQELRQRGRGIFRRRPAKSRRCARRTLPPGSLRNTATRGRKSLAGARGKRAPRGEEHPPHWRRAGDAAARVDAGAFARDERGDEFFDRRGPRLRLGADPARPWAHRRRTAENRTRICPAAACRHRASAAGRDHRRYRRGAEGPGQARAPVAPHCLGKDGRRRCDARASRGQRAAHRRARGGKRVVAPHRQFPSQSHGFWPPRPSGRPLHRPCVFWTGLRAAAADAAHAARARRLRRRVDRRAFLRACRLHACRGRPGRFRRLFDRRGPVARCRREPRRALWRAGFRPTCARSQLGALGTGDGRRRRLARCGRRPRQNVAPPRALRRPAHRLARGASSLLAPSGGPRRAIARRGRPRLPLGGGTCDGLSRHRLCAAGRGAPAAGGARGPAARRGEFCAAPACALVLRRRAPRSIRPVSGADGAATCARHEHRGRRHGGRLPPHLRRLARRSPCRGDLLRSRDARRCARNRIMGAGAARHNCDPSSLARQDAARWLAGRTDQHGAARDLFTAFPSSRRQRRRLAGAARRGSPS